VGLGAGGARGVLVLLVLAQWAAVGVFVAVVRHNGWLFYHGGDETFFYTDAWSLAHGHIPESEIGWGWSYLVAPLARIAGPSFLAALPAIVVVQVVVLLPVALLCVYAIGARIAGQLCGFVSAGVWIAAPFVVIPLFDGRYHARYVEQFLPQAFGLTGLGDFPSTVCLLLAAVACVWAIDGGDPDDAALAGMVAGFAVAIKPANALFLAGPLLALPAARRFRELGVFALALLPAVAALALWKYRGLGYLPLLRRTPTAIEAAGVMPASLSTSRYVAFDWSRLRDNYSQLHDVLPIAPVLFALPLLGLAAAFSRARATSLLLAGWFGAFVLVKGSSGQASIESGTLLRLVMPALPPFAILVACAPFLFVRTTTEAPATRRVGSRTLAVVAAVVAVVPLVLIAALPALHARTAVKYFDENVFVPVDSSFAPRVRAADGRTVVSWNDRAPAGTRVFYRVFRSRPVAVAPDPTLPPGRDGIRCGTPPTGYAQAVECRLEMQVVGTTHATRFADTPPAGRWVYRIGLAANGRDDPAAGDVMLLSAPVRR
jgi:hypothetical protein